MRTTVKLQNGTTTIHFTESESGIDRRVSTPVDRDAWDQLRNWSAEADRITGRAR